jgi:hypothetical protein
MRLTVPPRSTLLHIYAALLLRYLQSMRLTVPPRSTLLHIYAALLLRYYTYAHLAFRAREYEVDSAAEVAFGGLRCQYVYFCTSEASKPSTFGVLSDIHSHGVCSIRQHTSAWQHTSAYVSMAAYVSIRQHTSAYISMAAYVSIRQHTSAWQHMSAYVSICQHTSAYVSIRQHTSAYVSIRQHGSIRTFGFLSDIHSDGVCELQVLQRQRSLNRLAHTSAYVRIRQHMLAYVSIRQHTFKRQRRLDLLAFIKLYYTYMK